MSNCYIQTFSGKRLDLSNPSVDMFSIEDIIHGLSYECRWASQTKYFYSVAQHCIYSCGLAPLHLKLDALLHDWTEAFIKDIPRPIKDSILNYRTFERRLYLLGYEKFNLYYPYLESDYNILKEIDNRMAATECRDLMRNQEINNYKNIEPYDFRIVPMTFDQTYEKFMELFELYRRD